jgi:hypothetical protein
MNRARRAGVAVAAIALVAAGGFALPSTRAQLSDAARSAASVFTAGDWSDGGSLPGDLADVARRAACTTEAAAAGCAAAPADDRAPVLPWPDDAPTPAPAAPAPGSTPSAPPARPAATEEERDELPVEGESCDDEQCVQAAITVVDRFVVALEEDDRAPEAAVTALRDFVDEAAAEEHSEDVPLTDEVRDALDDLIASGAAPAMAPACLITLGELAAHLTDDPAADDDPRPAPSPCPAASATPAPQPQDRPSAGPSAQPRPTPSRSEADTDGDGETDTIYDKPGRPYSGDDAER